MLITFLILLAVVIIFFIFKIPTKKSEPTSSKISNTSTSSKYSTKSKNASHTIPKVSISTKPEIDLPPNMVKVEILTSNILKLYNEILEDKKLLEKINIYLGRLSNEKNILNILFVRDYYACLSLFNIELRKFNNENFPWLFFCSKMLDPRININEFIYSKEKYIENIRPLYKNLDKIVNEDSNRGPFFVLGNILDSYDSDKRKLYFSQIHQFATFIALGDSVITDEEKKILNKLLHLSVKDSIKSVTKSYFDDTTPDVKEDEKDMDEDNEAMVSNRPTESLDELLKKLDELVGLENIKKEIRQLVNFIIVQKKRKESGLNVVPLSYHIVFTGNPGTGKTIVARLLAEIYRALGILEKGHLVETDRSGLIAEYVGQTAVKVNKIVDQALDGILFIDEAYALMYGGQNGYGKEAVATLIKRMEDNRDRLVIILAGYSDEMASFIETNPGFKSRFNRYIHFEDYNPDELCKMFLLNASKHNYKLSEEALIQLKMLFTHACNTKDKTFGNGRFARNVFEKTVEKHSFRIAKDSSFDNETLTLIKPEDIPF